MKILGIETSCDETAIAIIESKNDNHRVLVNLVSSQIKIHSPFGGIVPSLAAREHQKNLIPILIKALKENKMLKFNFVKPKIEREIKNIFEKQPILFKNFLKYGLNVKTPEIDLIAVTSGPGLEIALWSGINLAKVLSILWQKPIIDVNHLEGHIYSNWLEQFKNLNPKKVFPALNLIVSGGHTQLVLQIDHGKYKLIGETLDDAAGEAFDKVARMLGLPYPGGPEISKLAKNGDQNAFQFPRPMINQKNYNFSFSGLKTAVFYLLKKLNINNNLKLKADIASSFQKAIIDVLVKKTIKAAKEFDVRSVLLSGGVSANELLRQNLKNEVEKLGIYCHQPNLNYTQDNASMIAICGYYKYKYGKGDKTLINLTAKPNLKIKNWN